MSLQVAGGEFVRMKGLGFAQISDSKGGREEQEQTLCHSSAWVASRVLCLQSVKTMATRFLCSDSLEDGSERNSMARHFSRNCGRVLVRLFSQKVGQLVA